MIDKGERLQRFDAMHPENRAMMLDFALDALQEKVERESPDNYPYAVFGTGGEGTLSYTIVWGCFQELDCAPRPDREDR